MTLRILPLLALAAAGAAPAHASVPNHDAAGPASHRVQNTHDVFRQKFKQAMELGASDECARLVRQYTPEAISWIIETAEDIGEQSSELLERRMAALRKAWRTSRDSDFADEMYEYFSLLEPAVKTERAKLKVRYDKERDEYAENVEQKDGKGLEVQSIEFAGIGDAFRTLGDRYFASQSFLFAGACVDEPQRGDDADLDRAVEYYGKCLEDRDAVDLKDKSYIEVKQRHDFLVANGYGPKEPADDLPGAVGPVEKAPGVTSPMTFELIEEWDDFERPLYFSDELYMLWPGVYLGGNGDAQRITTLEDRSPSILRTGANEVSVDVDDDTNGDVEIPLTGNFEPVAFDIDRGGRPWGVLTTIGEQDVQYQGVDVNLAPTGERLTLYLHPAGSVVGEIAGEDVRVLDDNLDGIYGSAPRTWAYTGMSEDQYCPDMDAIVIGRDDRARPWSELQRIGDAWYRLEPQGGGMSLTATPVDLETGTLKYDFDGGKPEWIVVRGTGELENCYFEVASRGTDVPVGHYELYYGDLREGKKRQVTKALILPGRRTDRYTVTAGETETIELGAPFAFDFDFALDGEVLTVEGKSVHVVGRGGERYERLWGCVPEPDVSWREAGSRRGSRGEEMEHVRSSVQLDELGWEAGWFPVDMVLELRGAPEAVEVQLTEKKNDLFGKIESEWKD